jgi:hypothetical protein
MTSKDQPHILFAAACFLAVSLLTVTGLEVTGVAAGTLLDKITLVAMLFFLASCLMSYASLRRPDMAELGETAALISFVIGFLSACLGLAAYMLGAL